jgi:hypothetical protein
LSANFENARVVVRFRKRVAKSRQEHFTDQLMHEFPSAAMGHQHLGIILDWERAGEIEVRGHGLNQFDGVTSYTTCCCPGHKKCKNCLKISDFRLQPGVASYPARIGSHELISK